MTPLRPGTLAVAFVATTAGEHALHVAVRGRPVQGSPFLLRVRPGPAAAAHSIAQGSGLVRAEPRHESTFVIIASDAHANRCARGGDIFAAALLPAGGGPPIVECEVVDCEDGTYLCLYTPPPDAPTRCELHIRLDDEGLDGTPRTPIRGSPFAVRCERGADLSAMRVGSTQ